MEAMNTQDKDAPWEPNVCPDPLPETGDELFSRDVERCVLGSMMAGPDESIGPISAMVPEDAFYYPEHRILYAAIANVYARGTIDLVLLRDYLKREGKLDDANGVRYYVDSIDITPSAANWKHYTDLLLGYYDKRNLDRAKTAIKELAGEPQRQLEKMQEIVDKIELASENKGALTIEPLADIEDRPLVWFWDQKIPDYGLSMLQGDPGVSKSYLTAYMAAQVSTGRAWPDCPDIPVEKGAVLIFNGEDDPARIKERCQWMEGNMKNIHLLSPGPDKKMLDIRYDLKLLQKTIDDMPVKCRLLVFDPITSYMGNCKQNNNNEVRAALEPLSDLAVRNKMCIVIINHMNKKQGEKYVYRGLGSMGFTAVCRSVWGIIFDENDDDHQIRILCPVKTNYSQYVSGLKYQIVNNAIEFESEPYYGSIDDASGNAKDTKASKVADAMKWLTDALAGGMVAAGTVKEQAEADGITSGTLWRAKEALDIRPVKSVHANGGWFWELQDSAD